MQSAVSGLNRGLAASEDDQLKADVAANQLEAVGGLVDLSNDIYIYIFFLFEETQSSGKCIL